MTSIQGMHHVFEREREEESDETLTFNQVNVWNRIEIVIEEQTVMTKVHHFNKGRTRKMFNCFPTCASL